MRKVLLLLGLALGALAVESSPAQAAPPLVMGPGPLGGVGGLGRVGRIRSLGLPGRTMRYGPYATLRRANQVARYLRLRGYPARVVFLGGLGLGNRAYAVRVWI